MACGSSAELSLYAAGHLKSFIISGKVKRARWGNDRVQTDRNKKKMKCYLYKRSSLVHKTCSDETGSTLPSLWTDSCFWVTVWKWKIFIKFAHKNEPFLWAVQKKKEKMTKYYFIRLVSEMISEKLIFPREKKHKFCHPGARNSNSSSIPDCFLFFCASHQFPWTVVNMKELKIQKYVARHQMLPLWCLITALPPVLNPRILYQHDLTSFFQFVGFKIWVWFWGKKSIQINFTV